MTDYFKRTFFQDKQFIESARLKDTVFPFKINELSTLKYMAETQNFFPVEQIY